jgi:hypothetical protein
MTKGFLIYAIGHRNYYHMAETLAASIRYQLKKFGGDYMIALVCDTSKNIVEEKLFDDIIFLPPAEYMVEGKIVFNNATIRMYDHSPFDVTIKLDADMIWLNERDPGKLFDQLKDHMITFENKGHGWNSGNSVWTDEKALAKAYVFTCDDKLYKIYGEFLYFKKRREVKNFFSKVKQVYNKPKVECRHFSNGTFTDELAYQIACMQTGLYPHADNFTPVLNQFLRFKEHNYKYLYQLPDKFFAYSIGGNATTDFTKNQYNTLAAHYYQQLGLQNPYKVKDKRTYLKERKKL